MSYHLAHALAAAWENGYAAGLLAGLQQGWVLGVVFTVASIGVVSGARGLARVGRYL